MSSAQLDVKITADGLIISVDATFSTSSMEGAGAVVVRNSAGMLVDGCVQSEG